MAKCIDELRQKIKDTEFSVALSDAEIKKIHDDLEMIAQGDPLKREKRMNKFLERLKRKNAQERLDLIEDTRKKYNVFTFIKENFPKEKMIDGLEATLGGIERLFAKRVNDSVHARSVARAGKLAMTTLSKIKEAGLYKYAKDKNNLPNIIEEFFHIDAGKSVTGDKGAFELAKILRETDKAKIQMLIDAGSGVEELTTHVTRLMHDANKIRPFTGKKADIEAGFKAWRDYILSENILDLDKTFKQNGSNQVGIEKSLRMAYNEIIEEQFNIAPGGGARNLDDKISMSRKFVFSDGKSMAKYLSKYGNDDVLGSFFRSIDNASRNASLIERFGTNPRQALNDIKGLIKEHIRDDPAALKRFGKWEGRVNNVFSELEGFSSAPGRSLGAKSVSFIKAMKNFALLSNAAIGSLADLATGASMLHAASGRGIGGAWTDQVREVFSQIKDHNLRAEYAQRLRIMTEINMGASYGRFSVADGEYGSMSKYLAGFFKWTGLSAWTEGGKVAFAVNFARQMERVKHLSFDGLKASDGFDGRLMRSFERYGIEQHHWDIMRQASEEIEKGFSILTPEAAMKLDDKIVESVAKQHGINMSAKKLKQETDLLFSTMITNTTNLGIPTPGVREKAILKQGTHADTAPGMFLRLATQYKEFPTTMIGTLQRGALSNPKKAATTFLSALDPRRGDIETLLSLGVGATVMGATANMMLDILHGREPKDPLSAVAIREAFVRGGFAGIYGDLILGGHAKFGGGTLQAIAGPTIGDAAQALDLTRQMLTLQEEDPEKFGENMRRLGNRAFKLGVRQAPLPLNSVILGDAVKYLFLYRVQESLNPGYLRRMERNMSKEKGIINEERQFFPFKPTDLE